VKEEQLSDPVHDDAGAELGELLSAELGPALAQKLKATLISRTQRSG
jgi:hypothetical protein